MRVADLARIASENGYLLVQHVKFSLFKDGQQVAGPFESLDAIDGILGVSTGRPGASGGPLDQSPRQ
jgi:hypothetical protein